MKRKRVVVIELTLISRIIPLVSCYLKAYADKDEFISEVYEFEIFSVTIQQPYEDILRRLNRLNADVYGFSCYCWNMGLVKNLLRALLREKPHAYYILGGPQVEHYGWKYLEPQHENVVICNGEGEKTFYRFHSSILCAAPGLSFPATAVLPIAYLGEAATQRPNAPSSFSREQRYSIDRKA